MKAADEPGGKQSSVGGAGPQASLSNEESLRNNPTNASRLVNPEFQTGSSKTDGFVARTAPPTPPPLLPSRRHRQGPTFVD